MDDLDRHRAAAGHTTGMSTNGTAFASILALGAIGPDAGPAALPVLEALFKQDLGPETTRATAWAITRIKGVDPRLEAPPPAAPAAKP
jgi:hypothetical protein